MVESDGSLHRVSARINARTWGIALGLTLGLALFAATNVLILRGGEHVGTHLGRLSQVLPGYDVTFTGSLIGFVYAFVIGYALGRVLGPRSPLEIPGRSEAGKHVRLRPGAWGATAGILLALGLFATTSVLVLRGGEEVGSFLKRLGLYFPGYSVSFTGSLVGAAYALAVGWGIGWLIARVYDAAVVRAER